MVMIKNLSNRIDVKKLLEDCRSSRSLDDMDDEPWQWLMLDHIRMLVPEVMPLKYSTITKMMEYEDVKLKKLQTTKLLMVPTYRRHGSPGYYRISLR